jgi:acyl-CoA thioester hydrolase
MAAPFMHRLRVRYGECDPQGVVFNANYFAYFDVALTELWREAAGSYTAMMAGGVDMVVAEARARYLAPARFDDELDIGILITHLGTTSMVTRMTVTRDETPVVEGEMRHVFIDAATGAKTSIPDDIRRRLEPHLSAGEEAAAEEVAAGERPALWSTSA